MSENKKVLIYGRSLNLEGIGVSLKLEGNLDVIVVEAGEQNCLYEISPEVVLFDLANPPKDLNLWIDLFRVQRCRPVCWGQGLLPD